jgi:hypothetical protein
MNRNPQNNRTPRSHRASPAGLTKFQITRPFRSHIDPTRIDAALQNLSARGALHSYSRPTGGRPTTIWLSVPLRKPIWSRVTLSKRAVEATQNGLITLITLLRTTPPNPLEPTSTDCMDRKTNWESFEDKTHHPQETGPKVGFFRLFPKP